MVPQSDAEFWRPPAVVASGMLLLCFFRWPYAYYTLLRIVVTFVAVQYAFFFLYDTPKGPGLLFFIMVAIAVLFNPVIPVHFRGKSAWLVIDVVVATLLLGLAIRATVRKLPQRREEEQGPDEE